MLASEVDVKRPVATSATCCERNSDILLSAVIHILQFGRRIDGRCSFCTPAAGYRQSTNMSKDKNIFCCRKITTDNIHKHRRWRRLGLSRFSLRGASRGGGLHSPVRSSPRSFQAQSARIRSGRTSPAAAVRFRHRSRSDLKSEGLISLTRTRRNEMGELFVDYERATRSIGSGVTACFRDSI